MNSLLELILTSSFLEKSKFSKFNLKICKCQNLYKAINEKEICCTICSNIFDVQLFVLLAPPHLSCYVAELFYNIKKLSFISNPAEFSVEPDLNKFLCKIKLITPMTNYCELFISLNDFEIVIRFLGMIVNLFYVNHEDKIKNLFDISNDLNKNILIQFNELFIKNFQKNLNVFQDSVLDANIFDFVNIISTLIKNFQTSFLEKTNPIDILVSNVIPKLKLMVPKIEFSTNIYFSEEDFLNKLNLLEKLTECINLVNKIYNTNEIDLDKTLHFCWVYVFLQRALIPCEYSILFSQSSDDDSILNHENMYEFLMCEDRNDSGFTNIIDICGSLLNRIAKIDVYEKILWLSPLFNKALKIKNEIVRKNYKYRQIQSKLQKNDEFLSSEDLNCYKQLKSQFSKIFYSLLQCSNSKKEIKILVNEYFPYVLFYKNCDCLDELKENSHSYYAFLFTLNYTKLKTYIDKDNLKNCLFSFSTKNATNIYKTVRKLLSFVYKNIPGHYVPFEHENQTYKFNILEVNALTFKTMKFYLDNDEMKEIIVDLYKLINVEKSFSF